MARLNKNKKRKSWEREDMFAAIAAVRGKIMGYQKAAKHFNVPKSTLYRFVNDKNSPIEMVMDKVLGRRPVLNTELENLLVEHISTMENTFYGLTRMDLRRLAYQVAIKHNLKTPFKDGFAGKDWLRGFLKRNPHIFSITELTATYQARSIGFTKEGIYQFYDNLEKIQSNKSFPAARIFNVDESALFVVQSKNLKVPKIIARKGKIQIEAMTADKRESFITTVTCMSPAGIFVPPMIIFPRKNMSDALMKGAPVGAIGKSHPSGWIQINLFAQWFLHFVEYVKPTEASPVLLILDGRYTHTKNIELIDLAKKHHVILLSLPPQCTHKVHPIQQSFMGPLKSYYSEEVQLHLTENNKSLTPCDVVELFGNAYIKCQTVEIAENGFRISGIYPFNRNAFTEADSVASASDFEEEDQNPQKIKRKTEKNLKKKRAKKTNRKNSTESDSSDSNPDLISGYNSDSSYDVHNEATISTDEDSE